MQLNDKLKHIKETQWKRELNPWSGPGNGLKRGFTSEEARQYLVSMACFIVIR
jgi:hypothetical protein